MILGDSGIWLAMPVSETLTTLLIFIYYLSTRSIVSGKYRNIIFDFDGTCSPALSKRCTISNLGPHPLIHKKKQPRKGCFCLAEREGFEPPEV